MIVEKLLGYRSVVYYEGAAYELICLHRWGVYEFYISSTEAKYPYTFMYAVMDTEDVETLMQTAEANAPEYIETFMETEWN